MPEVYRQLKFLIQVYKACDTLSDESKETLRYMQMQIMDMENNLEVAS